MPEMSNITQKYKIVAYGMAGYLEGSEQGTYKSLKEAQYMLKIFRQLEKTGAGCASYHNILLQYSKKHRKYVEYSNNE